MPNPKRKHTRSRRDSRRSANWRLELGNASRCTNCGQEHEPHRVCSHCGFYGGTLILPKKTKKSKGGKGPENTPPAQ
ncbi:MAG: 50S ribosomal protein L32 [Elusimicrobia bacterium]|nr:50S ribosomal protein L32 [Elusimicrobiota bacterium]